jgi:chemotaxis protein CheY-P-specific phosphatase CheC
MKSVWQRSYFKDIIKVGLGNAAHSLDHLLGDEVLVKGFEIDVKPANFIAPYQMQSDIVGDFGAFTLMTLNEASFEKAVYAMLEPKYCQNSEMRMAILQELNNILVASFVTKLSELLDCNIYGNVPDRENYTLADIKRYSQYKDGFMCKFSAFKSGVTIWFLCAFDDSAKQKVWASQWEAKYLQEHLPASQGFFGFLSKLFS